MYSRYDTQTTGGGAAATNGPVELKLTYHAFGPVHVSFLQTVQISDRKKIYQFVSLGLHDGVFLLWSIEMDILLNKMTSRSQLL